MVFRRKFFYSVDIAAEVTRCHVYRHSGMYTGTAAVKAEKPGSKWDCRGRTAAVQRRKEEIDMPSERFFRLSKAKRDVICEAIRREFNRVPVEKASVNQIVHNADISRGSFYTYFSDKYDALKFMMDEELGDVQRFCKDVLARNGGDLMGMFQAMFEYSVKLIQNKDGVMDTARNILIGRHDGSVLIELADRWIDSEVNENEREITQIWGRELYEKTDKERLNICAREEFSSLLIMGVNAVLYSIKQYYNNPNQLEVIRRLLETKLEILRNGAYLTVNQCNSSDRSARSPR